MLIFLLGKYYQNPPCYSCVQYGWNSCFLWCGTVLDECLAPITLWAPEKYYFQT